MLKGIRPKSGSSFNQPGQAVFFIDKYKPGKNNYQQ